MSTTFHIAQGNDDFYAFASLWPEKFGSIEVNASVRQLIENAFRSGSAILARNPTDGAPVAATVLDFGTYGGALFVPFILISETVSNRAVTQRRMLDLVLRTFEASKVERLLFVTDDSKDHRGAVDDFNAVGAKAGLLAALKIIGHAEDLYGDGRNVMFQQLFITTRERPDLTAQLSGSSTQAASALSYAADDGTSISDRSNAGGSDLAPQPIAAARASALGAAGIGAQVLNDRLMASACCSGCAEKSGKDGKDGKDGKEGSPKEGKDGKEGIERTVPSGKLNVEDAGVFALYATLGIKRFNRYAGSDDKFTPLV